MAAMVASLITDRVAPSGIGSSASLLKTWTSFHTLAFADAGVLVPLLPITAVILQYVGALFKSGGYRSFANYLSAAKAMHIEAGYEWTQLLAHTATWVTRSVLRGIGPSRQSCSFHFVKLCGLARLAAPLVTSAPQQPQHLAILATLFLLREVEASVAKITAWTLDLDASEITWNLPSSKSDPKALGVKRTWGCLCDLPGFACPCHIALAHLEWLRAQPAFVDDGSAPLFPTVHWLHAAKQTVVATFEALGVLMKQPLFSTEGLR